MLPDVTTHRSRHRHERRHRTHGNEPASASVDQAIIDQGGVRLAGDEIIMPDPSSSGATAPSWRACRPLRSFAFTTNLGEALQDPANQIYFDATVTLQRRRAFGMAIAAKKHLYCEKPTAVTSAEALALHREAEAAGLKSGSFRTSSGCPGF